MHPDTRNNCRIFSSLFLLSAVIAAGWGIWDPNRTAAVATLLCVVGAIGCLLALDDTTMI